MSRVLFGQSVLSASSAKKAQSSDDNLIPLINVVFLMLIFFMVAGQIQSSDAVSVQPPESFSETRQAEDGITLIVTVDGLLYLDNQNVDEAGLVSGLLDAFSKAIKPDAFVVLVKVDAGLPVDALQTVLRQIKATGLGRVSLATRRVQVGEA
ncbi:ExbD/TolR family protein [Neptunomonas antarctica]|uniref:Outer membrane transport energization protein ExbD n=1 Tax=Neptunomonas antarctica TaxID=619304 RepID=A0A1N7IZ56_9GAMM|nr:biopolymer transporter ExbD [Neptunomonas antarctica]SIS42334.1 outer membrane transport energization protein ExbD [Neptunomonas antarctica]